LCGDADMRQAPPLRSVCARCTMPCCRLAASATEPPLPPQSARLLKVGREGGPSCRSLTSAAVASTVWPQPAGPTATTAACAGAVGPCEVTSKKVSRHPSAAGRGAANSTLPPPTIRCCQRRQGASPGAAAAQQPTCRPSVASRQPRSPGAAPGAALDAAQAPVLGSSGATSNI
jgi:hypothetical protein